MQINAEGGSLQYIQLYKRPTLSYDILCIITTCIVENNEQFLIVKLRMTCVIKSYVTRSLRLEASFALWEDHFYIGPPHVPNPPKTGALV